MKDLIINFSHQLRDAVKIGENFKLKSKKRSFKNVIISGLGGSGIGGTIVSEFVSNTSILPINVIKGYDIPKYTNEDTLVICSSCSGNTEETIEVFNKSLHKNCEIVCISSGGLLIDLAKEKNLNYILLPKAKSPRTMIGYSITQILFILYNYDIISYDFVNEILNSADLIDKYQNKIQNESEKITEILFGKIPILYSCEGFSGMVTRFKQQLNENSKMLGFTNTIPEMNHNELVGWRNKNNNLAVIFFKNEKDYYRNIKRLEINKKIISKYTSSIIEIESKGNSIIENTFYLINLCDHVSYNLSKKNNVIAEEIDVIDYLKSELQKF